MPGSFPASFPSQIFSSLTFHFIYLFYLLFFLFSVFHFSLSLCLSSYTFSCLFPFLSCHFNICSSPSVVPRLLLLVFRRLTVPSYIISRVSLLASYFISYSNLTFALCSIFVTHLHTYIHTSHICVFFHFNCISTLFFFFFTTPHAHSYLLIPLCHSSCVSTRHLTIFL